MADIDAVDLANPGSVVHGGTWGNKSVVVRSITVPAGGAAIADVLRFCKLEKDTRLIDATLFTDTNEAASTLDLGYDDDADHFLAAQDIATAGRFRANTVTPPVVLTSDQHIVATVGGAALDAGTVVTVVVEYEFTGHG